MRITESGNGAYEVRRVHVLPETDGDNRAMVEVCEPWSCRACGGSDTICPHCGGTGIEPCGDPDTADLPHVWAVYERQAGGGKECVADCPTAEIAKVIATLLEDKEAES